MYVATEEDHEYDNSICVTEESGLQEPIWVGCDCGAWCHLYCVGLTEPDVPEDFVCNICREQFLVIAQLLWCNCYVQCARASLEFFIELQLTAALEGRLEFGTSL